MLYFQGLAITFASDENDAKVLNNVQERFDVSITELPDEIDLSSYSKWLKSDTRKQTVLALKMPSWLTVLLLGQQTSCAAWFSYKLVACFLIE